MRKRDRRYDIIKPLLNEGKIKSFLEIFEFIPKTVVANDLGKKTDRFNDLLNKIELFTFEEVFMLAKFCSIDERQMLDLVLAEYLKNKSKIRKSGSASQIP